MSGFGDSVNTPSIVSGGRIYVGTEPDAPTDGDVWFDATSAGWKMWVADPGEWQAIGAALPSGTTGQILVHNGTTWEAVSELPIT